jgi:hypothetical protein
MGVPFAVNFKLNTTCIFNLTDGRWREIAVKAIKEHSNEYYYFGF